MATAQLRPLVAYRFFQKCNKLITISELTIYNI